MKLVVIIMFTFLFQNCKKETIKTEIAQLISTKNYQMQRFR